MFPRSIWLLRLQVHPLRASQRGAALLVQTSARKQGRAQEDQERETPAGARADAPHRHRPAVLHAERWLHARLRHASPFSHSKHLLYPTSTLSKSRARVRIVQTNTEPRRANPHPTPILLSR